MGLALSSWGTQAPLLWPPDHRPGPGPSGRSAVLPAPPAPCPPTQETGCNGAVSRPLNPGSSLGTAPTHHLGWPSRRWRRRAGDLGEHRNFPKDHRANRAPRYGPPCHTLRKGRPSRVPVQTERRRCVPSAQGRTRRRPHRGTHRPGSSRSLGTSSPVTEKQPYLQANHPLQIHTLVDLCGSLLTAGPKLSHDPPSGHVRTTLGFGRDPSTGMGQLRVSHEIRNIQCYR